MEPAPPAAPRGQDATAGTPTPADPRRAAIANEPIALTSFMAKFRELRMMTGSLLANRFPLLLWWGPLYVCIYNDAYRPVLGTKHPWAVGRPVSEVWGEIWHISLAARLELGEVGGLSPSRPRLWCRWLQEKELHHEEKGHPSPASAWSMSRSYRPWAPRTRNAGVLPGQWAGAPPAIGLSPEDSAGQVRCIPDPVLDDGRKLFGLLLQPQPSVPREHVLAPILGDCG